MAVHTAEKESFRSEERERRHRDLAVPDGDESGACSRRESHTGLSAIRFGQRAHHVGQRGTGEYTANAAASCGELAEVIAAIRAGSAYANVHTSLSPGGEIRGQIRADGKD